MTGRLLLLAFFAFGASAVWLGGGAINAPWFSVAALCAVGTAVFFYNAAVEL